MFSEMSGSSNQERAGDDMLMVILALITWALIFILFIPVIGILSLVYGINDGTKKEPASTCPGKIGGFFHMPEHPSQKKKKCDLCGETIKFDWPELKKIGGK